MSLFDTLKTKHQLKTARKDTVFILYNGLVDEARNPNLYKDFAIPDTLDGRFDAIVFHIALFGLATNDTLKDDPGLADIGKDIIGVFLKDMDRNLREIGVGDLSVGKKVKKMASALYGRIDAYSAALVQPDPEKALDEALKRNLYRGEKVAVKHSRGLAKVGLKKFKAWQKLDISAIKAGTLNQGSSKNGV